MTSRQPCVHWFDIDEARPGTDGMSPGVCRYCGETRRFRNFVLSRADEDYHNHTTRKKRSDTPKGVQPSAGNTHGGARVGGWADQPFDLRRPPQEGAWQ